MFKDGRDGGDVDVFSRFPHSQAETRSSVNQSGRSMRQVIDLDPWSIRFINILFPYTLIVPLLRTGGDTRFSTETFAK